MTKAFRIRRIVLLVPFILLAAAFVISAEVKYRETIAVLRAVYNDEFMAQERYAAFAKKALAEGYPQIAYFFTALSISEGIHARNARNILSELKSEVTREPFKIEVSTTKENLKYAASEEIDDIEQFLPSSLKKISPENHVAAIQTITNELQTERLHLELLRKIQKGTGFFFGILAKRFEGTPQKYFVCQACGATTTELPRQVCPVCKAGVAEYKAVEKNF